MGLYETSRKRQRDRETETKRQRDRKTERLTAMDGMVLSSKASKYMNRRAK
jgi:hypothetical protein